MKNIHFEHCDPLVVKEGIYLELSRIYLDFSKISRM